MKKPNIANFYLDKNVKKLIVFIAVCYLVVTSTLRLKQLHSISQGNALIIILLAMQADLAQLFEFFKDQSKAHENCRGFSINNLNAKPDSILNFKYVLVSLEQ